MVGRHASAQQNCLRDLDNAGKKRYHHMMPRRLYIEFSPSLRTTMGRLLMTGGLVQVGLHVYVSDRLVGGVEEGSEAASFSMRQAEAGLGRGG